MRVVVFMFHLLFFFFVTSEVQAQQFNYEKDYQKLVERTKDAKDVLYYKKLQKRFASNDSLLSDFEVLALLINFTSSSHYQPYSIIFFEGQIAEKVKLFKYEEAILLCDSVLMYHPYNQAVLLNKAYAYHKLEKKDSAMYYKHQFNRILDAMAFSGNGSAKEPIFSLGSRDSENYIYERLARQILTIGASLDASGNIIDVIQITDYQTDTTTIHFQIQHAVDRLIDPNSPSYK